MNSPISPNPESLSSRWIWIILAATGLLRFINLGFLDLQAWDEALYTVRAQSILLWGDWLDQSTHAIGGLYSALHPPLQIWITALVFKILHVSEFSARLVPACAGALTLPVIFFLGKEIEGKSLGLLAALFYGLTPFAVFFTRQGQFDSLLTLWLTLSAYLIIKSIRHPDGALIPLSGVVTGFGLMTKLFVALGIPLTYALWILLSKPDAPRLHWRRLAILLGMACLIALPWHLFMTVRHGEGNPLFFIQQSSLLERSLTGIEGNVKPLEVLYYVNQMVVLFPFILSWFVFELWQTIRSKDGPQLFLALWFLVFFVVFSVMRTKLAFYLVPMLVPISLLAARAVLTAMNESISLTTIASLISGTLITVTWSISQSWRTSAKEFILSLVRLETPRSGAAYDLLHLILLGSLGILVVILAHRHGYLKRSLPALSVLLLIPLAGIALFHVIVLDRAQYKDGAFELARFVQAYGTHTLVVAGFDRNPQLTYYLGGADLGWRDDLHVRRITPPADTSAYRPWLGQEMSGEPPSTLLLIEKEKFIRYRIVNPGDFVPHEFQRVFESRRYSAFVRSSGSFYAAREQDRTSILLSH